MQTSRFRWSCARGTNSATGGVFVIPPGNSDGEMRSIDNGADIANAESLINQNEVVANTNNAEAVENNDDNADENENVADQGN